MPMDELQLELPPVAASGVPGNRPGRPDKQDLAEQRRRSGRAWLFPAAQMRSKKNEQSTCAMVRAQSRTMTLAVCVDHARLCGSAPRY